MIRLIRITLIVLVVALLAAACGGSDDSDRASEGPRTIRAEDVDTGPYEPESGDYPDEAGQLANGRALEARRIAEVIVDPVSLDERFQRTGTANGAMASPAQVTRLFSSEDPKLFAPRISGASSRRIMGEPTEEGLDMSIAVLTFTTPAAASAFVRGVAANNERTTISRIVGTPVYGSRTKLPGHPDVRAALIRFRKGDTDPSLVALTSRGQIAVYMYASGPGRQLAETTRLMSTAFTRQLEALEDFEPTPLQETLTMPVDEEGLLKLALAAAPGDPKDQEPDVPAIWGPNGALLQQTWPGTLAEAFERADMDAMVQAGSNVYRAGSTKQAKRLFDDFHDTVTENQYRDHHTPKGLRDARCYEVVDEESLIAPNFCAVQYGRYVAEAAGTDAADAEARISAQYLLLQDAAKKD